jgi:glycosyltransferase involved in cell wall biosynthesis
MLLSVIVPNYERLAYLRDGLVLLLQQSFPPE